MLRLRRVWLLVGRGGGRSDVGDVWKEYVLRSWSGAIQLRVPCGRYLVVPRSGVFLSAKLVQGTWLDSFSIWIAYSGQ